MTSLVVALLLHSLPHVGCPCGPDCGCGPDCRCVPPLVRVKFQVPQAAPSPPQAPKVRETPKTPLPAPPVKKAVEVVPPLKEGQGGAFLAKKTPTPPGYPPAREGFRWVKYPSGQWGELQNSLPESVLRGVKDDCPDGRCKLLRKGASSFQATPFLRPR